MDLFSSIEAINYYSIYIYLLLFCCVVTSFVYSSGQRNLKEKESDTFSLILTILLSAFLIAFLGGRPERGFGDTFGYKILYESVDGLNYQSALTAEKETVWHLLMVFCNRLGFTSTQFFILVETLYIGLMFLCCLYLMRKSIWVAMLFCLTSFSFYGYGVNGIRNGLACSLVMFGLSLFVQREGIKKALGILFFLLAYGVHNSTMLPSLCVLISCVFIKKPNQAINFWGLSIFISLVAGNAIAEFFQSFGFDDRLSYLENLENVDIEEIEKFSNTGFRFDFLIYSSLPVLFVWYLTIKRSFNDATYNIIANTYILSNAFWVMVIRATYSNRFAYLSWFLYPIVIAYPLLRMNIWDDQDRKTALVLLGYSGFTFVMYILGK